MGFEMSGPARNAREAVQWLYFAYLAAVKEQNGDAMSLGRVPTFLDIYFERDPTAGVLTETKAQGPPSRELLERTCSIFREIGLAAY